MLFKKKINASENGISDALRLKEKTRALSEKTYNKLLQIIYDDLRDVSNIGYANKVIKTFKTPTSYLTYDIAKRFLALVGHRDAHYHALLQYEQLYPRNMTDDVDLDLCHLFVEKMLSKLFFLYQLEQAKELMLKNIYFDRDLKRIEIHDLILRIEQRVIKLANDATEVAMRAMVQRDLITRIDIITFKQVVADSVTMEFIKNKSRIQMGNYEISMKRKVKDFRLLSIPQLKENIAQLLQDDAASIRSEGSYASIAAVGSADTVRSVGSAASVRSVGSYASIASVATYASIAPISSVEATASHGTVIPRPPHSSTFTVEAAHTFLKAYLGDNTSLSGTSYLGSVSSRRSLSSKVSKISIMSLIPPAYADSLNFPEEMVTDVLYEKMSFWQRLVILTLEDTDRYKQGTMVTLYYTGENNVYAWHTQEECFTYHYPLSFANERAIPTREECEMHLCALAKKYARQRSSLYSRTTSHA
ncbi:hypothetical protein [Enterobacter sp. Bisph1]|uniref:hypothetical protein n=1 Tax=Enterobacter sp. Bisph1 TaxID=1274399 RepID=UPI00057BF53C|nr:hypothetical protein [Enterobacter sp. Bisph1]